MDTILVVDPWPIVTSGLSALLHHAGIKNTVEQAHTVHEATQAITDKVGLLIFDPTMPETTPDMFVMMARRQHATLPILFFSSQPHGIHLALAQMLGVNGYLDKTSDTPTIIAAIRMVQAGMQCFPHQHTYLAQNATTLRKLSPKELLVLQLLRQGLRNKDIAQRLHLSPKTVSTHKRNLLRKLGTDDVVSTILDNSVIVGDFPTD